MKGPDEKTLMLQYVTYRVTLNCILLKYFIFILIKSSGGKRKFEGDDYQDAGRRHKYSTIHTHGHFMLHFVTMLHLNIFGSRFMNRSLLLLW